MASLYTIFTAYAQRGNLQSQSNQMDARTFVDMMKHTKLIDEKVNPKDIRLIFQKHTKNSFIQFEQFKLVLADIARKRKEKMEKIKGIIIAAGKPAMPEIQIEEDYIIPISKEEHHLLDTIAAINKLEAQKEKGDEPQVISYNSVN